MLSMTYGSKDEYRKPLHKNGKKTLHQKKSKKKRNLYLMGAEFACEHSVSSVSKLQWQPAKWRTADAEHDSAVPSLLQEKRLC